MAIFPKRVFCLGDSDAAGPLRERIDLQPGEMIRMAADVDKVHFFGKKSGDGL